MTDTPYYLSDAAVQEARKALDCLFIAVDESIAGEVSAKVRAGFEAVARVAEAKGYDRGFLAGSIESVEERSRFGIERDALRETVARLTRADTDALTAEILATAAAAGTRILPPPEETTNE